ncbi:IS66 family transposase, partial [Escherichia coli]|nr:IS66 family transposase [Escherichia coli]
MELQDWRKEPRKKHSNEFKLRMVELASQPGACVAQIARENGVNDNVIFKWLRLWQNEGRISRRLPVTTPSDAGVELLPVEITPDEQKEPVAALTPSLSTQTTVSANSCKVEFRVPRQLRQSRHRRPLPEHLPREINRLEPEESCCPECGGELDYLGEVSAEQLELVSSALKVIRTERVKKACTKCDCIVEAPAPSRPIERGIAGPGLLARVLTGKYCEHLPLYRQSEIFARQGVELSRTLLSNWVDACCQLMTPLNDALYRYVMNTRKVHTDDTPVKVLAPSRKKAKTGYIWTYVRDDR